MAQLTYYGIFFPFNLVLAIFLVIVLQVLINIFFPEQVPISERLMQVQGR